MGESHKESILRCLRQWHEITIQQGEALGRGDLERFEKLNKVSMALQSRFSGHTEKLKPARLDDQSGLKLLKEIHACQTAYIRELRRGSQEIIKALSSLSKNKASLKGYQQASSRPPRFKSERT